MRLFSSFLLPVTILAMQQKSKALYQPKSFDQGTAHRGKKTKSSEHDPGNHGHVPLLVISYLLHLYPTFLHYGTSDNIH